MKYLKSISARKWSKLSIKQKHNYWFEIYLDIEKALVNDKNLELDTTEILALLAHETDELLSKIYNINTSGKNKAIYLQNSLREIFNDKIVLQKDFHFLQPTINKNITKLDLIIILDNLRSAFNVGSIIRTIECLQIQTVYCCGLTPNPEHEKVKNTAMGTETRVNWKHFKKTEDAIEAAKKDGYIVYALETHETAKTIYEINYSERTAIVVGNEALGISEAAIFMCDKIISIPICGWKTSLNVATATAVVCFEIFRRSSL
jgi:tRNA G18 (ribose-2'-O)-methylase SpoU